MLGSSFIFFSDSTSGGSESKLLLFCFFFLFFGGGGEVSSSSNSSSWLTSSTADSFDSISDGCSSVVGPGLCSDSSESSSLRKGKENSSDMILEIKNPKLSVLFP
jgi:hypothetical protein